MSDLLDAVLTCDLSKLKIFIGDGKNVNCAIPEAEGCTILHIIAGSKEADGKGEVITFLLDMGANPNCRSDEDLTPVHIASMWNNHFELDILLQKGGNPWLLDNDGKNAFDLAADNYAYDTYKLLNQYLAEDKLNFIAVDISPKLSSMSLTDDDDTVSVKSNSVFFTTANEYLPLEFSSSEDESKSFLMGVNKIIKKNSVREQLLVDNIKKWNDFANNLSKSNSWSYRKGSLVKDYPAFLSANNTYYGNKVNTLSSEDSSETIIQCDNLSGIVLVEKTCLSDPFSLSNQNCHNHSSIMSDWKSYRLSVSSSSSECSSFSNSEILVPQKYYKLSNSKLFQELVELGDKPGPVNDFTREVYLKRLTRLKSGCLLSCSLPAPKFCPEMYQFLKHKLNLDKIQEHVNLMTEEFNNSKLKQQWREGNKKCSFNYFLLDPRVTQNLAARQASLKFEEKFQIFIDAIFYVGKGTKGRPYNHLVDAAKAMMGLCSKTDKITHILEIWNAGYGVISLHCFHNCIPAEAYTQEACIIEALGIKNLTNVRVGDYYGKAAKWTRSRKRKIGISLLNRALQIFLHEGEKQIKARDLKEK